MLKVIVIDDEKYIRRSIIHRIEWEKCGTIVTAEAGNGKEALERMQCEEPDIALTDLRMPLLDGLGFIEESRKRFPKTHYIIMSAYSNFEYARTALRLGVADYILKPVKKEELEKVLKTLSQHKEKKNLHPEIQETCVQKKENKNVIENIMEYIQKHYYENINVSELAEMYYLNDTYLSTLFKEKTGWTLKSYLESVRIEKAKSLLKSRDYTIAYVASAVGYTDPNYFSKVFKRYTDLTPRQFRDDS